MPAQNYMKLSLNIKPNLLASGSLCVPCLYLIFGATQTIWLCFSSMIKICQGRLLKASCQLGWWNDGVYMFPYGLMNEYSDINALTSQVDSLEIEQAIYDSRVG
jgi:hypothetical protein